MGAQNTLTWDLPTPRRPGIDDLGGGAKENARGRHANPATSPIAEEYNQLTKQIAALAKVAPGIRASIRFSAGAPILDGFESPSSIAFGDITVVDNGTGDTTIKWASGRIPLPQTQPRAWVNGSAADYRIAAERFSGGGFDGVRVRTKDAAAAADIAFTFET
jgi:hypothetical protein